VNLLADSAYRCRVATEDAQADPPLAAALKEKA